jgi:hypothetical protein
MLIEILRKTIVLIVGFVKFLASFAGALVRLREAKEYTQFKQNVEVLKG